MTKSFSIKTNIDLLCRTTFVNHPDQPNIAQLTSIMDWLHNLQLDRLIPHFHAQHYTNLSQICHFDGSDFHDLIDHQTTLTEQTRLFDHFNHLRSQLLLISSTDTSLTCEGYLV